MVEIPPDWEIIDFVSDIHLHSADPITANAFMAYLQSAPFDALFILGDLFEVWVGDDVLETRDQDPEHVFIRQCCAALSVCAQRKPVHVLHGNRDFLLGSVFFERTHTHWLPDGSVLHRGAQTVVIGHGDAWCLDDRDYLQFRQQVRNPQWQSDFLSQPLQSREAIAAALRERSENRKSASQAPNSGIEYADVDSALAQRLLQEAQATTLVHGHTHRPAVHPINATQQRMVLSDWDAQAHPPRLAALRWNKAGEFETVPLSVSAQAVSPNC